MRWPSKLTAKILRERGFVNVYDCLRDGEAGISYVPGTEGRMADYPRWQLIVRNRVISPGEVPWRREVKEFPVDRLWRHGERASLVESRETALAEAKGWIASHSGVDLNSWVKTPYGWITERSARRIIDGARRDRNTGRIIIGPASEQPTDS